MINNEWAHVGPSHILLDTEQFALLLNNSTKKVFHRVRPTVLQLLVLRVANSAYSSSSCFYSYYSSPFQGICYLFLYPFPGAVGGTLCNAGVGCHMTSNAPLDEKGTIPLTSGVNPLRPEGPRAQGTVGYEERKLRVGYLLCLIFLLCPPPLGGPLASRILHVTNSVHSS